MVANVAFEAIKANYKSLQGETQAWTKMANQRGQPWGRARHAVVEEDQGGDGKGRTAEEDKGEHRTGEQGAKRTDQTCPDQRVHESQKEKEKKKKEIAL